MKIFFGNLGAFPALRAGNRAFRSNSAAPAGGLRYFRFNPLREPKPQSGFGFANRCFFPQNRPLFFL
jgi:hypothetical protein